MTTNDEDMIRQLWSEAKSSQLPATLNCNCAPSPVEDSCSIAGSFRGSEFSATIREVMKEAQRLAKATNKPVFLGFQDCRFGQKTVFTDRKEQVAVQRSNPGVINIMLRTSSVPATIDYRYLHGSGSGCGPTHSWD